MKQRIVYLVKVADLLLVQDDLEDDEGETTRSVRRKWSSEALIY